MNIRTTLIKQGIKPEYNDIFNNVFSNKTPEAVHLGQRTEARLIAIKRKFNLTRDFKGDVNNPKIDMDMKMKSNKDNAVQEQRKEQRRKLAF